MMPGRGGEGGRRVLLMSHGAGPYGAERILLALASALRDEGHAVTLDFPHEGPALEAARARGRASGGRPAAPPSP